MKYEDYLKTPEWQAKRTERLRADEFRCARCKRPYDLQVHHLNYDRLFNEDIYTDLITLCKTCHSLVEEEKKKYRKAESARRQQAFEQKKKATEFYAHLYCKAIEKADLCRGGKLNLCNLENIKQVMKDFPPSRGIGVLLIQAYFREKHYKMVLDLMDRGYSQYRVQRMTGLPGKFINKVFRNPQGARNNKTLSDL